MPRHSRSEAIPDVPSPSGSSDEEGTFLPNVTHLVHLGPISNTLLYKHPTHRSTMIWETLDTDVLTVRHRGISWDADERVLPYIIRMDFGPWYYMQNYEVDWSFMTTLVERWRFETHSFHLRHGEMPITLEDVGILTGLPIEGRVVTMLHEVKYYGPLCVQMLGVVLHGMRPTTVRQATELEVQRYTRAYILALLGSSLLPDSSGSEISIHFLPLLANLDSLSCYSWGGAVFAYLYRSLCNACESKATQLIGCAILLQLWAWEHLITGRPRKLAMPDPPPGSDIDPMQLPALGYKWYVPKSFMPTSHHVLMLYRDLLDRQEANDVVWTSYTDEILATLNPISEWHYPSRVLRQFGWRQPEPTLPLGSHKEMHMHIRRTTHLVDDVMQGYINLWDNRAATIVTEHEHYVLVASLVRTCKTSASLFLKTTDKEVKRQLHDMFHATHADLLIIGEGRALDVDVAQIHLLSDSDEDLDTFDVGPSQVNQAESQRSPLRRVSTRSRKTTRCFTLGTS
ncbi:hypothetical protein QQ045_000995 [Rhodiola kirilowii]